MDPAVLADLVGRVHVDPLAGTQLLDQLAAKLRPVGVVVAFAFELSQPLACSADHEVADSHAFAAEAQRVERLAHGWRLGDRVTSVTGGHLASVAPGTAPGGGRCMRSACDNVDRMSMVQIRNVPEDLHRELKARAAHAGMTLSDYLLQEMRDLAVRPTMREWAEEVRKLEPVEVGISPAEAIRAERDRRAL